MYGTLVTRQVSPVQLSLTLTQLQSNIKCRTTLHERFYSTRISRFSVQSLSSYLDMWPGLFTSKLHSIELTIMIHENMIHLKNVTEVSKHSIITIYTSYLVKNLFYLDIITVRVCSAS